MYLIDSQLGAADPARLPGETDAAYYLRTGIDPVAAAKADAIAAEIRTEAVRVGRPLTPDEKTSVANRVLGTRFSKTMDANYNPVPGRPFNPGDFATPFKAFWNSLPWHVAQRTKEVVPPITNPIKNTWQLLPVLAIVGVAAFAFSKGRR